MSILKEEGGEKEEFLFFSLSESLALYLMLKREVTSKTFKSGGVASV
jgi:hypothetical protein